MRGNQHEGKSTSVLGAAPAYAAAGVRRHSEPDAIYELLMKGQVAPHAPSVAPNSPNATRHP